MNTMGEVIAEIALRPDRLAPPMAEARKDGLANLSQMQAWIDAQPRLAWVRPQAGLIGLGRLPDGIDSDDFVRVLLAEPYRTFLLRGSAYDQLRHIRLGVGGGGDGKPAGRACTGGASP